MKNKPDPVGSSEIDTDETVAPSLERERALVDEVSRLTAQLQAETAAHQRTEADKSLLSSIVESSEDSIVSITFDAVITSWNKGAENLYGYPATEVLGQPLMKLTLPEDLQEVLARIDKVKHHQSVELFTTTRVHRDGTQIWLSVQMSPVTDATGELIGISTIARDISAGKFAEEIARAVAQQNRLALDYAEATLRTAPVPLLVLEDDLRVRTANQAFYENFQVAPDESEGRLIYDLGNGQWDIPKLRELLEEILPENNPFKNFEVTHEFESIGRRTMVLSAQRMENEADQPRRIVVAIEDISERKRDEDSRATLAAVVESSDDAIISKNLDGIITSWNGGAERLFGYTAREAIGQPVMILIPPELEAEEPGILDRIRHGEALGHHETVRCRKDRTRVDVSLTVSPIFDAHGRIVGASKVARDITERKQAEEALRASEERFRAAADAVSDMIWTNNPGGEMKGDQSVWGVFTGQTQEDYDGHGWTAALHPEDVQPTRDAWKRAVTENRTFEFEHRVRRHDGEWRLCSVLAVPVLDSKGGIREWVGVHTDITERKLAERLAAKVNEELLISSLRLRESEERTRLATEATEVGIWEWNVHTDAIRWDAQMFRLYGIVPAEDGFVHYNDWRTAVLPEDLPENERILQATVRSCGRSHREFRIRRREDGEIRDIESVETVRTNGHGQADLVLGTNLDITERKRVQAALIEAKENAEAASRAKDEFLAALSHELRTPLTPVLMAATALSTDPSLPAGARGQLDMMRRNIELEARIIDDLLDLTRISHGKLILAPVTEDIHELLHHTDEIIRSDYMGKRLHVVLKLDAARHHALADPARIQQVFWNLLSNAVKFTPDGGTITVSSHNGANGKIIIRVADNGIGIRAEFLAKIFDAFEQGDTSGEHRYGGLGLGLAISSAVVNAHGGQIQAASAGRGHGAEFTVTLGSVPAPAARSGNESPQGLPARSLSLLIIEDHEASRTVMEHLLTLSGHRVTTASTVHDAIAAYKAAPFDAVISDLGLPDGSGVDLMLQIQSIRPVPAIALSGYGMESDLQRTKDAGFSAHLVKPVKMNQLKQMLSQLAAQGGQDGNV